MTKRCCPDSAVTPSDRDYKLQKLPGDERRIVYQCSLDYFKATIKNSIQEALAQVLGDSTQLCNRIVTHRDFCDGPCTQVNFSWDDILIT